MRNPANSQRLSQHNVTSNSALTKREFLKFCGCELLRTLLCVSHRFPETSRAQAPQKGLVKTKLSPYFTSLEGGDIRCELCPHRCRVAKGKRGTCRVRKTGMENIIAWPMEIPVRYIQIRLRKNPFFMFFPALPPFHSPQQVAISSANSVRIGKSHRHFPRMFTVMKLHPSSS